ncbi:MAG: response regulator [Thermosynechococcaceae cyanobacterium MS004]|nr:response regulator [Thermosynechococcaceae cyanobacterium MS004]
MTSFFDPSPTPSLAPPSPSPQPIRILIVDDQNFVRKMLQYSLSSVADFEIIGAVTNGQDALTQIEQLHPDIALVDIEMPGMSGLEMTRNICEQYSQTKVLVLSIHDDDEYIRDALQAGAKGYLLKNTPPEELAHAIRFVQLGYLQLGPGLFEKLESYPAHVKTAPPATEGLVPQSPASPPLVTAPVMEAQSLDLDWSAATHEAVNTLPRLWVRGILYLMLAFTAVVLPWAAFSQVDEVGVALGRLEPKGKTIRLDAPVVGTVSAIRVKEGQIVQQGQPLMEMQSEVVNADLQQAQTKLEGLLNRQTQLLAVKTQLESSLSTAQQQARAQAISQQATIEKAQKQQTSLQESISLIQALLDKDQAKILKLKSLSEQGAVARSQVEDAERIMIQNSQQLERTQADIQQAEAEVQKQRSEYQRVLRDGELSISDKIKQVKELQSQIIDAQSEAGQTRNLIKSLQYQRQQRVLYSPANGTLFQLLVQHPGAVVQPGQLIAQIAPKTARLVLRARIENKQTGFLKVGMPAKIKFDAYPFQDYGIQTGKIVWIAPTATQPLPSASAEDKPTASLNSSLEVEIELDRSTIQAQGKVIALKAGQTATAEIITRQRRILDLFLDPFRKLNKNGLTL